MSAVPSLWRQGTAHWPLALACAVFLLGGALALDDYPMTADARTYDRALGKAPLDYLAGAGEGALDQLREQDRYFGMTFQALLVLAERGLSDSRDIFLARHLITHVFFLFGGIFCYLLVYRIFNSKPLALAAMVLFLLHPRLYAHSFFNSRDIPFLAMFMIALWLVHRAFRRDTLAAFLLCGAGIGILANLRVMGIVLFAAVLVLRGLDVAFARSREERGRALLTGGAFALAAMLAYYAVMPALWTDPVGRLPEMLRLLNSRPLPLVHYNLFQGESLYSRDGPPFDYVPVWIGITTPPATFLLALAGAATLTRRALRRPRDIFRNGPLRFGLLLLAIPIVVMVAVVVLESNVQTGWRYFYFLFAPLCLLAAFGLWQPLSSRGKGRRWMRAGAYALTGMAVVVAIASMVRIHPHQNNYFNSLVDRTTPERLSSLYTMNYWRMAGYDLLGDIVGDHPSGDLNLWTHRLLDYRALLPANVRERIVETRDFYSGEHNSFRVHNGVCHAPAPVSPVSYVKRIYAVTLRCLVDPVAWFGSFRREALASGEPLVRSTYHIHRDGSDLTYLRDGCPAEDAERGRRFFLHVTPVDAADLPPDRAGIGFDNRDFPFGARIDGTCIAIGGRLPDYPIASIHTGQFSDAGVHWEVEFTPDGRIIVPPTTDLARARREALAREPLARSVFNVYRDGRTLAYVRDGCTEEEAVARFFLHVEPLDPDDLPVHRREHGFDNLDFTLGRSGARVDGNCIAVATLPDYPIASVRTGQYDGTGAIWETEFSIPEGE